MTSSSAVARRVVLALGLSFALPWSPRAAFAQPAHPPTAQELETARTLYREGKDLRAAGDLKGALEKLQAAHALGHTPVTGIELARTFVMVGRLVEAREVALSIARLGVASDETGKSAEARTEAAKLADDLRPRIPALTVKIAGLGASEIPHLSIDGAVVPDVAVGEAQKVDPGKHEVAVRIGEGAAAREGRASAELAEGQSVEVAVQVPPARAGVAPPADGGLQVREAPHGIPRLTTIGVGVAIAGTAVAIFGAVRASDLKSRLDMECNTATSQCGSNNGGASDLYEARTWATVANVGIVAAGVGLATAVTAFFVDRGSGPAAPTASGASARARAVRIVPDVGLAALGMHGEF